MNQSDEPLRKHAVEIWKAGVAAVDAQMLTRNAARVVNNQLTIGKASYDLASIKRIAVLGAGKASGWMAAGLVEALGSELVNQRLSGWVNVPEDQVIECGPVTIFAARPIGENLPTQSVLYGSEQIMHIANELGPHDLCVCLVSGGGSALLEQPIKPVNVADIRSFTALISSEKASIKEINTVRKKLSLIKGGGLAIAAHPAQIVSLILSDIVGDPIDLIASGPTVKDDQAVAEAVDILLHFDPDRNRFAPSIWKLLDARQQSNQIRKWPKDLTVDHLILGNNALAVDAACQKAQQLGYESHVTFADDTDVRTADETGIDIAHEIVSLRGTRNPVCLISGGEPAVKLSQSPGKGGRNQQLVLAALIELINNSHDAGSGLTESSDRFCLLSAGTDGEDGNVPIAGAVVDQSTVGRVIETKMQAIAKAALDINDSYTLFESLECTFEMHPTKTNVTDLRVALVATTHTA